jgi:hypothetical protein
MLENELDKEKTLKIEEIRLSSSLRLRETELLEKEVASKVEIDYLEKINNDLMHRVRKFEEDILKNNEEV